MAVSARRALLRKALPPWRMGHLLPNHFCFRETLGWWHAQWTRRPRVPFAGVTGFDAMTLSRSLNLLGPRVL